MHHQQYRCTSQCQECTCLNRIAWFHQFFYKFYRLVPSLLSKYETVAFAAAPSAGFSFKQDILIEAQQAAFASLSAAWQPREVSASLVVHLSSVLSGFLLYICTPIAVASVPFPTKWAASCRDRDFFLAEQSSLSNSHISGVAPPHLTQWLPVTKGYLEEALHQYLRRTKRSKHPLQGRWLRVCLYLLDLLSRSLQSRLFPMPRQLPSGDQHAGVWDEEKRRWFT